VAQRERLHEAREVGVGPARIADPRAQVAAGQRRVAGPGPLLNFERIGQQVGGFLGELAERRDLAAPDRQQRSLRAVEVEQVVARHGRRIAGGVVEQRTHARVAPDHLLRRHRPLEVAARLLAQVRGLGRHRCGPRRSRRGARRRSCRSA
jgi:hypothetical protein